MTDSVGVRATLGRTETETAVEAREEQEAFHLIVHQQVTSINHLDIKGMSERIRSLNLAFNDIQSISGTLCMPCAESVNLGFNCLESMKDIVQLRQFIFTFNARIFLYLFLMTANCIYTYTARVFPNVLHLDLRGNPVCADRYYPFEMGLIARFANKDICLDGSQ